MAPCPARGLSAYDEKRTEGSPFAHSAVRHSGCEQPRGEVAREFKIDFDGGDTGQIGVSLRKHFGGIDQRENESVMVPGTP